MRRRKPFGFRLSFFIVFMLLLETQVCDSLNAEGLALLKFRGRVATDPYGVFTTWNSSDVDPCLWFGVKCVEGEVHILDLRDLSLEGTLAPELEQLSHLRALVLYKNHFSGFIPRGIGGLSMLELLDLRYNNFTGTIPIEIGRMMSLKRLLLCGNKFHGSIPSNKKLTLLSDLQFDKNFSINEATETDCRNKRFARWFKFGRGKLLGNEERGYDGLITNIVRRRLFEVSTMLQARNLHAALASGANLSEKVATVPQRSGAFSAVIKKHLPLPLNSVLDSSTPRSSIHGSSIPSHQIQQNTPVHQSSTNFGKFSSFIFPGLAFFLAFSMAMFISRYRRTEATATRRNKLSASLRKAIASGIAKLNRADLQAACEDFSNIICTPPSCIVYKGTLSSGVEIAVFSSIITSANWSKDAQNAFRKMISTLSRVNHKNFLNILGYCEEERPFTRMMVFEYAPNGTLHEHLHVKQAEHIDWNSRVRIIMGMAYCLDYMHHELNPPVSHANLQSDSILLTDDYAAKVADIAFWIHFAVGSNFGDKNDFGSCKLPTRPSLQENVYSFGRILLEIISAKVPIDEEQGSLVNWASGCLDDEQKITSLVDPILKSFKTNELKVICEVIQECIHDDPRQRPTMREVTAKLKQVIPISADAATPKNNPLWWAELEILSMEAT